MNKLGRFYVVQIRDQLGRYANWPINGPISLGQVGFYHGRDAQFDWQNSLATLGVAAPALPAPSPPPARIDDLYSTEDSVRFNFTADDGGAGSKALFNFYGKKSLAFQGYQMNITKLDLGRLLANLTAAIKTGLKWNFKWLILTEPWVGSSFTTMISGNRQSEIAISARTPPLPPGSEFNIANPAFGLGVSSMNGMSYKGIAEQQEGAKIYPFFDVHKLIDHQNGPYLKKYRASWWQW